MNIGAGYAGTDMPLAVVDGVNTASPQLYYVHTDHINRPIRMSTTAKVMVWQAEWDPWGGVQSLSGALANNLRFPGQWFQIETGLHYNWHRHYDPSIGRYTQPDPLGFVDGPSVYAYARSSPLQGADRDGRYLVPGPTPIPPGSILRPPLPGPFPPWPIPEPDPPIYSPPRNLNPPSPGFDNEYYHRVCGQQPPSGLSACQRTLWELGRQRLCLKLRKKWRDDYGPAPHDNQIPEVEQSIENLELRVRKLCNPSDLFACGRS